MIFIIGAFIMPRFFNALIPAHRIERGDGKYAVQPQVAYMIGETLVIRDSGLEAGSIEGSSIDGNRKVVDNEVNDPALVQEKH